MAAAQLLDNGVIQLQGDLTFSVIMPLRRQVEKIIASAPSETKVDFSQVGSVDSSALSFWLCCLRYAELKQKQLKASNVPEEMLAFARVVGLDHQFA